MAPVPDNQNNKTFCSAGVTSPKPTAATQPEPDTQMPLKKSELYTSLWKSCDELRGGMDASQYKDYVLVLLFVKYVSDKYAGRRDALIEVPPGGSFADMVAARGDKEIGDKLNKIIGRLAEANDLKAFGYFLQADVFNRKGQPDKMRAALEKANAFKSKEESAHE